MAEQPPNEEPRDTTRTMFAVTESTLDEYIGLGREDQAAISALPPGSALLIVHRGPNTGSRFLLDSDRTRAGRSPGSEIFLDDVTVSRKHAEFVRGPEGFEVRDTGSLNGTYVNRERVDSSALRAGDEVQIGRFRMTFHPHVGGTTR